MSIIVPRRSAFGRYAVWELAYPLSKWIAPIDEENNLLTGWYVYPANSATCSVVTGQDFPVNPAGQGTAISSSGGTSASRTHLQLLLAPTPTRLGRL